MKRTLIIWIVLIACMGCSRNGEYQYLSQLNLIEPAETLLPKITQRLTNSEFRKNYDQTLVDRIGSSFKNFTHIRAYQVVLEDALIYLMIKTNKSHLDDNLRNALIHPVSKLILSHRSGNELIAGLDKLAQILNQKSPDTLTETINAYDAQLQTEGD